MRRNLPATPTGPLRAMQAPDWSAPDASIRTLWELPEALVTLWGR